MKVSIDGSNFSWALNKVGFVSVFVSMLYIQEYFGILQENNIIYIYKYIYRGVHKRSPGRPWQPLYALGDHPLREGCPAGDYGFSFIANVR